MAGRRSPEDKLLPDVPAAVHSTTEPAYAVRLSGEIVAWNEAASRLLGYPAAAVVGRACFRVLCGRDPFGNRYCIRRCPVRSMACERQPMARFDAVLRDAAGRDVPVRISLLALVGDEPVETALVHLLQPLEVTELAGDADGADDHTPADELFHRLTPRQIEVLKLLAAGSSTRAIARRLGISQLTVRNHVESLLRKLEVHSRLEAVSLAHRSGLV